MQCIDRDDDVKSTTQEHAVELFVYGSNQQHTVEHFVLQKCVSM